MTLAAWRQLTLCLCVSSLLGCAAQTKVVKPDWQNSAHKKVAECLMEQALIAKNKLTGVPHDSVEATFCTGKIACARYYVNNILPEAFLTTELIKNEGNTVITCPEEAWVVR